jgi:hypothetical protein
MGLTTFKQLKDNLADWVGTTTTSVRWSDTTRGVIVNDAIRYLARKHDFRHAEKVNPMALVAGTNTYTVPTDWGRPLIAWFVDPASGTYQSVGFKTKDEFDQAYPSATVTGAPAAYTIFGTNLYIGPTPSQNVTLNLNYYSIPAELASDSDSNGFTLYASELVRARALVDCEEYLIEDSRLDVWKAKWRDLEGVLVMDQARARSSGRIPQTVEAH